MPLTPSLFTVKTIAVKAIAVKQSQLSSCHQASAVEQVCQAITGKQAQLSKCSRACAVRQLQCSNVHAIRYVPFSNYTRARATYCFCNCSELTDEDVRTAIKNSGGVKGSLLIPEAPFELLVRRAISRLLPSALQCQQFVHAELLRIASQCAPADVTRFPNLQVCTCCVACAPNQCIAAMTCLDLLQLIPHCRAFVPFS